LLQPALARQPLLSAEQIAVTAAAASPVVILNEAHSGMLRSPRTREVGAALLPTFHAAGFRVLALEALDPGDARLINQSRRLPEYPSGYLSQPDMRALIQSALDLGWQMDGYDVTMAQYRQRLAWAGDPSGTTAVLTFAYTQWREEQQAENLVRLWQLRARPKMVVWCGNGHLKEGSTTVLPGQISPTDRGGRLRRMGGLFAALSGQDPFTIDQSCTVEWPGEGQGALGRSLLAEYGPSLAGLGPQGGGLLAQPGSGTDAVLLSADTEMR
jgi:hypothetical protein